MLKRYCTTCANFEIHLEIDAHEVVVPFNGKDVLLKLRYIDTENEQIQKALEANPAFNVYYFKSNEFDWMEFENTNEVPTIEASEPETPSVDEDLTEDNPETPNEPDLPETPDPPQDTKAPLKEFGTVVEAKDWLNKTYKIPYNKLKNKEMLVNEFGLLGFDLKINN
jgi:hypothetical protein